MQRVHLGEVAFGRPVDRALRKARKTAVELTPETARECLERHGGNISAAARAAGVARTTFRKALGSAAAMGPGPGPAKVPRSAP